MRITYEAVKDALDNAVANGYIEMLSWEPARIAEDLTDCCSDFNDTPPGDLIPHIHRYARENGHAR